MKKSTRTHILEYLNHGDWACSAVIDEQVGHIANRKASTVSRMCRSLAEEEKLEKKYKGGVVWYRLPKNNIKRQKVVEIVEINGERIARIKYI